MTEHEWRQDRAKREVWIPIELLVILRASETAGGYQRDAVKKTVTNVSTQWDYAQYDRVWVVVLDVEAGTYQVTDGGNRVTALRKMGYSGAVPCCLRDVSKLGGAARAFLQQNENRFGVTAFQKFEAACVAGEGWALSIEKILAAHGLRMAPGRGGKPGIVSAAYGLRRIFEEGGGAMLDRVVGVALRLFDGDTHIFHQEHIHGLYLALKQIDKQGLSEERLIAVVSADNFSHFLLCVIRARQSSKRVKQGSASNVTLDAFRNLYNQKRGRSPAWV